MSSLPTLSDLARQRTDPERYLEDFEEEQRSISREFLSIKNLDTYFTNIYEYHRNGGYWSIIYSKISNLITIAFTITLSVFLVGFVNWHSVLKCGNEDKCDNAHLIENNLSKNKVFGSMVVLYTIVFVLYFVWHFLNFLISLSSLNITHRFYVEKLQISDQRLKHLEWSTIMNKIVSLQQESIRLYHNKYLDALDITNRILRKENYFIAFINCGVLQFTLPRFSPNWLCWAFRTENRRNTNEDILRTDMQQHTKNKRHNKAVISKANKYKNTLKNLVKYKSADANTNRHLLASITPSSEETTSSSAAANKAKFNLTNIKSKIKTKFKDKRKGYQHVQLQADEDEDEEEEENEHEQPAQEEDDDDEEQPLDAHSDVSDVSDILVDDAVDAAEEDEHEYLKQHPNAIPMLSERRKTYGYLGNILEWNIRYIIFGSMFDDEMRVQDSFKSNSSKLKWKLFWYGVGNLVLTPFTLVFRFIFFFLQNAEEMHSNKSNLFSFREWTSLAKLRFREFNELPHDFEKRMNLAIKPSTEYIDSFAKASHVLILSELISYISGSIVAVLLLLTFIDSSILLNIQLLDRSLVWFLAIFSALLALARSNIVYNDPSTNYEAQMNEIARHTHYFPVKWQHKCHKTTVKDQFMLLYQPKFNLFLNELIGVFTTPFILMFTLPHCVDQLLTFITQYSDYVDGVGDICSYSRFDFKRFQNEFIAKQIEKSQLIQQQQQQNDHHNHELLKPNDIGLLSSMDSRQTSNTSNISSTSSTTTNGTKEYKPVEPTLGNKKLESSLLTFAMNNPKWRSRAELYQSVVLQALMQQQKPVTPPNKQLAPPLHLRPTASTSASTAQLGLTFSELLASPRHSQMQGHFDVTAAAAAPSSLLHSQNMDTSHFFNTLLHSQQESSALNQPPSPRQPLVLSEIHESDHDMDELVDVQSHGEYDELETIRPYKTLAMQASTTRHGNGNNNNNNDNKGKHK